MRLSFSIRDQFCPNGACTFFRKIQCGNVVIHGRDYPRLRCTACLKTWVPYRYEFRYGLRIDAQKFFHAVSLLEAGHSVRKVAVLCDVHPSTVQRWKHRFLLF